MQKRTTIILELIWLTMVFTFMLISTPTHADNDPVTDEVAITVPVSCLLSGTNLHHTADMHNDEFLDDIGSATIAAHCNDTSGFAIYAIGYTNDEDGNNYMIDSSLDSSFNIPTGKYTAGTTTNSVWSMKLTPVTGPYAPTIRNDATYNFTDYELVPSTHTKVASYPSNTDLGNESLGSNFTTDYAVYISNTQNAGTYTGQVKFTLVHPESAEAPLSPQPSTAGCINYFANASNAVGTMGCQSATDNASIELLASNFSRTGYGFAGWSDSFDYATNPNAHFYGPQETITAPVGTTANGLSLYAVWVKSEGNLQDASKVATLCGTGTGSLTTAPTDGTANLSSVSALTDQRDNNTYAIAKLADGKCWMIENLRLEAEDTRTEEKQALAQGYGTSATYGNFGGLADAESTNFSNSTTANSLYYSGTQSGTASISIGTTNNPGYRMPRYNNWNNQYSSANRPQNPTTNSATNSTTNAGMYSYGNYYTWHAAIADLTYNGTKNQSTTDTSLCPKGWHLPTGGMAYASGNTSGVNVTGDTSTFREFYNLGYKTMDEVKTAYEDTPNNGYAYYSSNTTNTAGKTATAALSSFPNNFLYSGYFYTSSANIRESYGVYWSSTAYDNVGSYLLYLNSSNVFPGTGFSNKYYGRSIRCTAGS